MCDACNRMVPVNGIFQSFVCPHCATVKAINVDAWRDIFGAEEFAEALTLEPGTVAQITSMGHAKYEYGRRMPRCEKTACKTPLDTDAIAAAAAGGGLNCPACGDPIRVRPADELVRALVPQATLMVNEGASGSEATASKSREPIMIHCVTCGGSLSIDGGSRSVMCSYCGGDNYLPDSIWLRLHPQRTVRSFFLLADYAEEERWMALIANETQALAVASRHDVPASVLAALARHEARGVRATVASNPGTPTEVLKALAGDDDDRVRTALASHPGIAAETLIELAADRDHDVREAVAHHRSTPLALTLLAADPDGDIRLAVASRADAPPEPLTRLAEDSNHQVREAVAGHPSTPPKTLLKLSADNDKDVRIALRLNPNAPAVSRLIPTKATMLVLAILILLVGFFALVFLLNVGPN